MKKPSPNFKLMWNGKSNVEGLRFVLPMKDNALKYHIFGLLNSYRNSYNKRVRLTVQHFLTIKDFGLHEYSKQDRLDSLGCLVKNGKTIL